MIDRLNFILRDLVQTRIPSVNGLSQVGFEPPNDDWRQNLVTHNEERINIFLYQVAENLHLRTNERVREFEQGWIRDSPPPFRVDCRYLITAWSPVPYTPPGVEPTSDENGLLAQAMSVFVANQPLSPVNVYLGFNPPSGNTILSVPAVIRNSDLPTTVALPDGMHDRGDFWSTMRLPWRAAFEVIVTIPLWQPTDIESPVVTTLSEEFVGMETILSIGGRVLTPTADSVGGAWVRITGVAPPDLLAINRRLVTQADGRFVFDRLRAGQYHLRAVASGLGDIGRDIEVPSPTGEYDLRFP